MPTLKLPLQVVLPLPLTTHAGFPYNRRVRSGASTPMQGMCKEMSFAMEAGSLSSHNTFLPAGSHSQYLQEAFIANTCQVFSINTNKDIFHTFQQLCKCLFSQCTKKVSVVSLNRPLKCGLWPSENLHPSWFLMVVTSPWAYIGHLQKTQFQEEFSSMVWIPCVAKFCSCREASGS